MIDLTKEADVPPIKFWIKDLCLFPSDKQVLLNGDWLTDAIITAGQKLLLADYPHVGGLQPACLAQKFQFNVQRGNFVQILNVYGSHWLTISNVGCPDGTVDSLPNCALSVNTELQIAAILFLTDYKQITVNFVDVQIQGNSTDCGVYAWLMQHRYAVVMIHQR